MIEAACHVAVEGVGHLLRGIMQWLIEDVISSTAINATAKIKNTRTGKKTKGRKSKAAKGYVDERA